MSLATSEEQRALLHQQQLAARVRHKAEREAALRGDYGRLRQLREAWLPFTNRHVPYTQTEQP